MSTQATAPADAAADAELPAHLPVTCVLLDTIAGLPRTNPALVVAACVHIACDFGRHLHLHDEVAALLRACAAELQADAAGAAHRTLQ